MKEDAPSQAGPPDSNRHNHSRVKVILLNARAFSKQPLQPLGEEKDQRADSSAMTTARRNSLAAPQPQKKPQLDPGCLLES